MQAASDIERQVEFDFLRATEIAALNTLQWLGKGNKEAADAAADRDAFAVAAPDRWFTYYYWLDDAKLPDFARTVDIHRKPGYDPVELFLDPKLPLPAAKIAWTLARKKLGFRTLLDVIGTDASLVRGSHGRLPATSAEGPVLLCTDRAAARDHLEMREVRDLLLDLVAG